VGGSDRGVPSGPRHLKTADVAVPGSGAASLPLNWVMVPFGAGCNSRPAVKAREPR